MKNTRQNTTKNKIMKDIDDNLIDKLPKELRAELMFSRPRKYEKAIVEILKKEKDVCSINFILLKLWTDYNNKIKRPALIATLNRLIKDGKIFRSPGEGYMSDEKLVRPKKP